MLYFNCSVKRLKFAPKWSVSIFSLFNGHFCYHSNSKSQTNIRLIHLGQCSNKLKRILWKANSFLPQNGEGAKPWGVLWYFHTYAGSGHFLGFEILNFNIFLGFQRKKNTGMKLLWIFWGSSQNWSLCRVYFYAFLGLFLRSLYRMGIFRGLLKFQI